MAFDLPNVPLRPFCETSRFHHMDRLEQYFRNKQDDYKRYDWDGCMRELGGVPGAEVPDPDHGNPQWCTDHLISLAEPLSNVNSRGTIPRLCLPT